MRARRPRAATRRCGRTPACAPGRTRCRTHGYGSGPQRQETADRQRWPGGRRRLLQHHVRVDPAEAERVDPRPTGRGPALPRFRRRHRPHPGPGQVRMRFLQVQRRRQHPLVHGQRGLDQPGHPGGLHRVPQHRLHRPEADPGFLRPRWAEHLCQGVQFGGVAHRRARAVRLQQPQRARRPRIQPGFAPGPLQGLHLAGDERAHQARRTAVPGHPRTADDGVDAVAVALRVRQPLQQHHPGALGQQRPVGPAVEGPDPLARAQRPQLGEHAPQRRDVAVVHRPRDHRVAATGREQPDRLVDGQQGGGAGRVQGVGGTAEVQPVRGPGGREARHQPDRGVRPFRAQRVLEGGADRRDPPLAQLRCQLPQGLRQLVRRAHPLVQPGGGHPHEPATAQHHPDPGTVGRQPAFAARVRDRLGRRVQRQHLVRLGTLHGGRHDPEPGRVEGGEAVDEATAPAVEAVAGHRSGGAAGVVVHLGVPAARGTSLMESVPARRLRR